MYREFGITKISTSLSEKNIHIEFSLDVDPDTVTSDTIAVMEKESRRILDFAINTNRNIVVLTLNEWPKADTEYIIRIQSGIQSIVEDNLPDSLQRAIIFKSEVTSAIEIISPAQHEETESLLFSWREVKSDDLESSLVYSYYLEVAKENAFYNIVRKTTVEGQQEIKLLGVEPGQYYVRIRAQKGASYGKWSETITFIVVNSSEQEDIDDEDIIFEDELLIVSTPVNGETPGTFVIEFDEELDPGAVYEVSVTRRRI